jgi:hypothetical protein
MLKQLEVEDWIYVNGSQGGSSYYSAKSDGYEIQVGEVTGCIEVAVFKSTLLAPPLRIEIPLNEFHNRYSAVMDCIVDYINRIS